MNVQLLMILHYNVLMIYVTEFVKKDLIHASNLSILRLCNLAYILLLMPFSLVT